MSRMFFETGFHSDVLNFNYSDPPYGKVINYLKTGWFNFIYSSVHYQIGVWSDN